MGWSTIVVPILLAAPGYFGGNLSFGALMMAVGAFNQVQQALRWFIDNFSTIADWRATLQRIATFREAMIAVDTVGADENQIEFTEAADSKILLQNLEIATPSGCAKLDQPHVEITQGERVLIAGEPVNASSACSKKSSQMRPLSISAGPTQTAVSSHELFGLSKEPSGRCFIPDLSSHGFDGAAKALRPS